MKNKFKTILLLLSISLLASCKTILISEKKVPMEKICGSSADYDCRATGFGSATPTYRNYKKERPNVSGKGKYAGLGRSADIRKNIFHNTYSVLELDSNEVNIEKTEIDYDLKKDNLTKIVAGLNAELKKQKISADAKLQIKNDFEKALKNSLVIKAYIETYTMTGGIQDSIRDAYDGINTTKRYTDAVARLKEKDRPLIRQVIVIREICEFNENKNVINILEPILNANIGEGNAKANAVLTGTLKRDKVENFATEYDKTTVYSYGYFSDDWMYKK
ncbi:hypothetical protein [Sediminibacter sp. Hel_I_10]|uniref:hypothetical protein n=1 Tax=Sediminibacter sp. Hel_I_10 TaxID=1392490 RepID=UPI0012DCD3BA|nr:hypothetical protein [Sediminibacter sp. Hel_I_10]